ncbi:MAG: DUF3604 domain-containing protein [Planctomycetes bacterium]|nr:DUF3604 domain-containing protein [Planctomycetota bacterium]
MQGRDPLEGLDLDGDIWLNIVETVDADNDPGTFTMLAGFEWTFTPQGDNSHRVVIFRDGAEQTSKTRPCTVFEGSDPELLWDYLAGYEAATGARVIAVPHNANMSNGLMFAPAKFDGSPMDADYAAKRVRSEPMHEMTKIKGDEETHPVLSAHWADPDFDPAEPAFYYVRAIESPKARWTTQDAVKFGIDRPDSVPSTVQDRVHTSPIWYMPAG